MGGHESELPIEPVCIEPRLVGCQLYQHAAAAAREPGNERELHGRYQLPTRLRDHEKVRGVGVDGTEGPLIGGQILSRVHAIPGDAELIGGKQIDDGGNIADLGLAQHHGRGT